MPPLSVLVPRTSVYGNFVEIMAVDDPRDPGRVRNSQLLGMFRLRLGDCLSVPIRTPGRVHVTELSEGRFLLTNTSAPWAFTFPRDVIIGASQFGPHARFPRVIIGKYDHDPSTDAAVECSPFAASLWRHGRIPDPQPTVEPNLFVYPTKQGPRYGLTGGLPHPTAIGPNGRPIIGVYVVPHDNHLAIKFSIGLRETGSPPLELDHLNTPRQNACSVRILPQSVGLFRLGRPMDSKFVERTHLEIDPGVSRDAVADVRVWKSTRLQLPKSDFDNSSFATSVQLVCSDRWLCVDRFEPTDIVCRRIHELDPDSPDCTMLHSSGDRLKFWLPLPQSPSVTDVHAKPHFSYRDPAVTDAGCQDNHIRRTRYYGLRIRGLGSSCEHHAKLDTNALRIELNTPQVGDRTFEFMAGFPLTIGSTRIDSLLVPKPNRNLDNKRIIEVPVKQAFLQVEHNVSGQRLFSPLRFNTLALDRELTVALPHLLFPPGVPTSKAGVRSNEEVASSKMLDYAYVDLALDSTDPDSLDGQVAFTANDHGVFPIDGNEWTERFGLYGRSVTLPALEPVGFTVTVDPQSRKTHSIPVSPSTRISQVRWSADDQVERAVFSDLNLSINYSPTPYLPATDEDVILENAILVQCADLDRPTPTNPENGLDNLMLIYSKAVAGGEQALSRWINDNVVDSSKRRFVWPIAPSLRLLMKEGNRYCHEIAQDELRGNGNAVPGLCFDYSSAVAVPPESLGFETNWRDVDRSNAILWPRSFQRLGARLDPTSEEWRGFFLADIPALISLNPGLEDSFPVLKELFVAINDRLMLRYGWRDEAGWTWKASISTENGIDFTPSGLNEVLGFKLLSFETTGAVTPLLASGALQITLKRIRDANGHPYVVEGQFSINLSEGTLGRLRVELPLSASGQGVIDTTSVPGIRQLRIERFETDLKKLYVEMAMVPDQYLAAYLPIFSPELKGTIAIDLVAAPGDNPFAITAILPDVKRSTLFGKFACDVQGVRCIFEENNGREQNTTLIHATLSLGRGAFASAGAVIRAINQGSDDWQFDVAVNRIGGGVSLGGVTIEATVQWKDPLAGDNGGALPRGDSKVDKRDLWGSMAVKGIPGTTQELAIDLRISSGSQTPFWVAVAQVGNLSIGPATVKDLIVLAAQNADMFVGGKWVVAEALTDVVGDRFRQIFPPNASNNLDWLSDWTPRFGTPSLAALSGYLNFGGVFATPPKHPDRHSDATTFALAEGGLFRISSKIVFDGLDPIGVAISYEPARERYHASFDLPRFQLSSDTAVDGGQLALGFGRDPEYYRVSLGWPELLAGSAIERDWTKSVSVTIAGAWPINTYWGGVLLEYKKNEGTSVLIIGLAIRAGWTYTFKITRGPAEGTADLGFAFGGVIELTFSWGDSAFSPDSVKLLSKPIQNRFRAVTAGAGPRLRKLSQRREADAVLSIADRVHPFVLQTFDKIRVGLTDVKLSLYADVWGKAAARFMGHDVANIEIEGKARIHGEGWDPIRKLSGSVDFKFTVEVGCVSHTAECGVDCVLIDR